MGGVLRCTPRCCRWSRRCRGGPGDPAHPRTGPGHRQRTVRGHELQLQPGDALAFHSGLFSAGIRQRASRAIQLTDWGLVELAFASELIVSELVTNAIRYAGAPIGLRLIRDQRLICEVSDPSQTQPHLRRARLDEEGGRGLFLVAQLTHRWGSRYTSSGKTIWTEQLLDGI